MNTEGREAGNLYAGEENNLESNFQLYPEEKFEVLKEGTPGRQS